ncbi:MAG: hypothetical protein HC912_01015 [Saprospiraceae bacterium]|nr:hypothetical protein [Saprospiraceae bacterium]
MRQAKHDELKLEGFKWQILKRPKSVADLLVARSLEKAREQIEIPASTLEENR